MEHLHLEGMKRREAGFQDYGIPPYRHARGFSGSRASLQDFTSAAIRRDSQYAFYGRNTVLCSKREGLGSMQSVLDGPSAARTT